MTPGREPGEASPDEPRLLSRFWGKRKALDGVLRTLECHTLRMRVKAHAAATPLRSGLDPQAARVRLMHPGLTPEPVPGTTISGKDVSTT